MIPSEILQHVAARMRDLTNADGQRSVDLPALSLTDFWDVEAIAQAVLRMKARGWEQRP